MEVRFNREHCQTAKLGTSKFSRDNINDTFFSYSDVKFRTLNPWQSGWHIPVNETGYSEFVGHRLVLKFLLVMAL